MSSIKPSRDVRLEGAFVELAMAANNVRDPALCGVYVTRLLQREYTLVEIEEGLASTHTLAEVPAQYTVAPGEKRLLRSTRPLVQVVAIEPEEYSDADRIRAVLKRAGKKYVAVLSCVRDISMGLLSYRTSANSYRENLQRLHDACFAAHPAGPEVIRAGHKLRRERDRELAKGLAKWVSQQGRTLYIERIDMAMRVRKLLEPEKRPAVQCSLSWMDWGYTPLWERPILDEEEARVINLLRSA